MGGDVPVDLDLRLVRYFIAVAERGHFGRAAQDLFVGQPSLSRSIRQLETVLGAVLLDRTPQGARLTASGEAFLPWARELLRDSARGVAAARAASEPPRLVAGYTTNLLITPPLQEVRRRHPGARIDSRHLGWDEPHDALVGRRVDAVVARLPLRTDGLLVTPLYQEPRVLMVSKAHRLAGRTSVTFEEIADDPLPVFPDSEWNSFWRVDPRPDGRPAPGGPNVERTADSNEWVASGDCVSFIPSSAVPHQVHPGCTTVDIPGIEPCQVIVVTRADDDNDLVAAFANAARTTLTQPC